MAIAEDRRRRLVEALVRLEAGHEIENRMGRLVAAVNFGDDAGVLAQFALDRDAVSIEYADEGRFVGPAAVTAIVREAIGRERRPGEMIDLHLTTPIIEVAADNGSARCLWWSPGAGALPTAVEPTAIWAWGMIASNWVPGDDGWKILNLHYFRYILCSYDKGWVEDTSMRHRPNAPMHPLATAGTWHEPYSPLGVRVGVPAAPRPYATFDGSGWMTDQDKRR